MAALAFGTFACASSEDTTSEVVETDGIRAESRPSEDCDGDNCIVTTLTDAATNAQLATVTWNGDTGIGSITEPHRTTQVTADDRSDMTLGEANEAAHHAWLAMTRDATDTSTSETDFEIAPDSASDNVGYANGTTCETKVTSNSSCTCFVTTCFWCVATHYGEQCQVSVSRSCFPTQAMYVGTCS